MFPKFLSTIFAFFITILATISYQEFVERGFPFESALFLVGAGAAFLWGTTEWFICLGRKNVPLIRKWLDKRSIIEGEWYETVEDPTFEGRFSILVFSYNSGRDQYQLHGFSFDEDGTHIREFDSHHVATQIAYRRIHYYYWARVVGTTDKVNGMGYAEFAIDSPTGKGEFTDHTRESKVTHFSLSRISTEEKKYCLGRPSFNGSLQDYQKFIKWKLSENGNTSN